MSLTLKQQLAAMAVDRDTARRERDAAVIERDNALDQCARKLLEHESLMDAARKRAEEHLSTRLANGVQLENLRDKNAELERTATKATADRKVAIEAHAKLVEQLTTFALQARAFAANLAAAETPAPPRRF